MSFASLFLFSRPRAAVGRNASGELVSYGPNVPRFDHDEAGMPLGLLIERGPFPGQGDRLELDRSQPWWETSDRWSILHAHRPPAATGAIVRQVHYCDARTAPALVDACLAIAGHHVTIGAVPGTLEPNRRGEVRYAGHAWALAQLLALDRDVILSAAQRPVIA